jgi:hypothetical protein
MKPSSSQKKAFTKVCSYYYSESSPRHEMLHNMKFHHRNATPSPSNCLNTRSPSAISQDSLDSPWPKLALQAKLLCRAAPFELGTCQILWFPFRSRHGIDCMRSESTSSTRLDAMCIYMLCGCPCACMHRHVIVKKARPIIMLTQRYRKSHSKTNDAFISVKVKLDCIKYSHT